mgnify:CR=1 FL=1
MLGKSHTDPEARPFALKVMKRLNDKCREWKEAEHISYSVYGTPMESTTYKFSKCLQKRFGIIPGVTDKIILQTAIMSMYRSRLMHSAS